MASEKQLKFPELFDISKTNRIDKIDKFRQNRETWYRPTAALPIDIDQLNFPNSDTIDLNQLKILYILIWTNNILMLTNYKMNSMTFHTALSDTCTQGQP